MRISSRNESASQRPVSKQDLIRVYQDEIKTYRRAIARAKRQIQMLTGDHGASH
jgi:hypothetical protein